LITIIYLEIGPNIYREVKNKIIKTTKKFTLKNCNRNVLNNAKGTIVLENPVKLKSKLDNSPRTNDPFVKQSQLDALEKRIDNRFDKIEKTLKILINRK
jgi:hypothetical protein